MQMTALIITIITIACSTITIISTETVPLKVTAGKLPEAPATTMREKYKINDYVYVNLEKVALT